MGRWACGCLKGKGHRERGLAGCLLPEPGRRLVILQLIWVRVAAGESLLGRGRWRESGGSEERRKCEKTTQWSNWDTKRPLGFMVVQAYVSSFSTAK